MPCVIHNTLKPNTLRPVVEFCGLSREDFEELLVSRPAMWNSIRQAAQVIETGTGTETGTKTEDGDRDGN